MDKTKEKEMLKISATAAAAALVAATAIYFVSVRPSLARENVQVITNEAPAVSLDTRDSQQDLNINPFAGRYVTYEGLSGVWSDGNTFLTNPKDNGNDIFIEFVVSEDENVVYSSDLVPSGEGIDVDLSQFLPEGDHDVTVTMNPYLLYEGEYLRCPVNNAQSVKVSI